MDQIEIIGCWAHFFEKNKIFLSIELKFNEIKIIILIFRSNIHYHNQFLVDQLYSTLKIIFYIYLARTPEIGQGLGRILSCGARKPEQT